MDDETLRLCVAALCERCDKGEAPERVELFLGRYIPHWCHERETDSGPVLDICEADPLHELRRNAN